MQRRGVAKHTTNDVYMESHSGDGFIWDRVSSLVPNQMYGS